MPRKKREWPATVERKLGTLVRKGLTAAEIAAQLTADGVPGASVATVGRRMRDLRGTVRATKAASKPVAPELAGKAKADAAKVTTAPKEPVARVLSDVPEDAAELDAAPMAQIDLWLERIDGAWATAELDNNLAAQASLAARATALLEAKRKGSPPPVQDPNDAPDLIDAAKTAREKIMRKLEQAIERKAAARVA
jgi:hypothetical protein